MSLEERFKAKIEVDTITGCHNWKAFKYLKGYGQFQYGTKYVLWSS